MIVVRRACRKYSSSAYEYEVSSWVFASGQSKELYVSVQTRAAGATVGEVDGFKMKNELPSSSVGMYAACTYVK